MHNSYYFLRIVARDLDVRLKNYRLVSCFSQTRDELIFEFYREQHHFFIRASLLPELAIISFPPSMKRARKNSVDLFAEAVMKNVVGARSFENDRSFSISLEGGLGLLFKMHGSRANVLFTQENRVVDIFRKDIVKDYDLKPDSLAKPIDWLTVSEDPRNDVFTFSPEVWAYLEEHGFRQQSADEQWQMIIDTKNKLQSATRFFHIGHEKLSLSLLPYNTIVAEFDDPLDAVTAFAASYSSAAAFKKEKQGIIRQLKDELLKTDAYISKMRQHLEKVSTDRHFQVWGDLLMANLQKIPQGASEVLLPNFYDNEAQVRIRLNPQLTPQKNAEIYYRKAKNRSIEIDRGRELLIAREIELLNLNQLLSKAEAAQSLPEVRAIETPEGTAGNRKTKQQRLPYRETELSGFRIWIGKGAEDNDELTTRYGYKEDLWLHAKDTSGSHVLVKHQSGKTFPKNVIERAAQLAAFYSKRKTESLCPVAYTLRKYVRKRKGDPAGMVVIEREKVILVEPKGI